MTGLNLYFAVFFAALFLAYIYLIVHEYSAFGERVRVWLPALLIAVGSITALGVFLRVILGAARFHEWLLIVRNAGTDLRRPVTIVDMVCLYGGLCVVTFFPVFQFLARREKRGSDDAIAGEIARWKSEQEQSKSANSGRGV